MTPHWRTYVKEDSPPADSERCANVSTRHGVPWRCERRRNHGGPCQVYLPGAREAVDHQAMLAELNRDLEERQARQERQRQREEMSAEAKTRLRPRKEQGDRGPLFDTQTSFL